MGFLKNRFAQSNCNYIVPFVVSLQLCSSAIEGGDCTDLKSVNLRLYIAEESLNLKGKLPVNSRYKK